MKNKIKILVGILILISSFFVYKFYDFQLPASEEHSLIILDSETSVVLRKTKIDKKVLIDFLSISKNNHMHFFLRDSNPEFYFLENFNTKVALLNNNGSITYKSSILLKKMESDYLENYVNTISKFIIKNNIQKIIFEIQLPISEKDKMSPPHSPFNFYGNCKGGKIPVLLKKTYDSSQ